MRSMVSYVRQFIAGPIDQEHDSLTESHRLSGSVRVIHDRNLSVAGFADGDVELIVFGQIVDPDNPGHGNDEVVKALAGRITSFADFETCSEALAGRWIAFLRIDQSWRVYPDACGTRTAYYVKSPDGLWVASQPRLLADLAGVEYEPELQERLRSSAIGADSWPLEKTPYKGVRQLVPNHFLDLSTGETTRFWPRHEIEPTLVEDTADTVERILHNTLLAMTVRGSAAMPLTGGYDSRMLLACAKDVQDRLSLVRVSGYHLPLYDTMIPNKLAKLIDKEISTIASKRGSREVVEAVANNTGGMYWGPADYMIHSFGGIRCDYLLLGQIGEVTRCFYYPEGAPPQEISAELLAKTTNYGDSALASEAFAQWLTGLPACAGPFLLDLLYWEHRVGNWAANLANALDTFFEPVYPFNCRHLLVSMLGVPVEYRVEPHRLHRIVCAQAEPRFDDVVFNTSRIDRLIGSHWRLAHAVRHLRKMASGF